MTVDAESRTELVKAFGADLTDDILSKLQTIIQIFNVDSNELFLSWESFNVNQVQENLTLDLVNLDKFQEYLQTAIATPAKIRKELQSGSLKRRAISTPILSSPTAGPRTPHLKRKKIESNLTTSSPGAYETAQSSFKTSSPIKRDTRILDDESNTVIETLNPQIDECAGYVELDQDSSTAIKPFKLATNFDASKYNFRTMSMKLLESADVLDDQIDSFAQLYLEHDKNAQIGNPCLSSQFDIVCAGRIVPDSPTYDKLNNYTLNKTSLFLETSRMGGIGQRIPLDLNQLKGYSLFPGQIVILKGKNPTGRSFLVAEVLQIPDLPAPVSSEAELEQYKDLCSASGGIKVAVALGPFSNPQTLNYDKFSQFIDHINTEIKPHVVVLNGPFVDISNATVQSGDIEIPGELQPRNLDEVFKKLITPILSRINPRIQVILIPALTDCIVKHCSYPQDSFDRKKFGLPKNIKVLPNPSSFSINEALFGYSNLDIFKDLKDVYQDDEAILNNRFERVANHILEQRRYYPYIPGSIKRNVVHNIEETNRLYDGVMGEEIIDTSIGGASLEIPYLGLTELGASLPDILVCPSELKAFAKVVKGVVTVNPGYFIRGVKENGNYAVLSIDAPDVSNNVEAVENLDLFYHSVYKRARVDLFRS